ncbi:IDEAL domain-containing protein [Paenibacillus fonticola]|uniref:IDEAL domain-containing protein n=1 Tax=Paenibacillus fonticola TaxID=379896 RepID=UPI00037DE2C0|nr:IDEAL domain-containing protein [Paenibacillus fonticola]
MDQMKVTYEVMLGLAAEMIWDEALRKHRSEQIYHEIDSALAKGDEEAFRLLTEELKALEDMKECR